MNRRQVGLTAGVIAVLLVGGWLWSLGTPATEIAPTWSELPRRVTVEVLNGGRVTGAGREVTMKLRDAGLDVVDFEDAPAALMDTSRSDHRIFVRRGDTLGVGRIAEVLGSSTILDDPDPSRLVDLTVVLARKPREPADTL